MRMLRGGSRFEVDICGCQLCSALSVSFQVEVLLDFWGALMIGF